MHNTFSARKGQSAIEYLMTYGWMLLVVAIVGGAVITTVQSNQNSCQKQINGFSATSNQLGVSDFTVTSSALNIQLQNNYQESVTINYVNLSYADNDTQFASINPSQSIGFGDQSTFTFNAVSASDSCSSFDVAVDYDRDGLPGELTGQIQDQMA